MSLTLKDGNWRGGYRAAFFIQAAITAAVFLSLPLWQEKRNRTRASGTEDKTEAAERESGQIESDRTEAVEPSSDISTAADSAGVTTCKKPRLHGLVYVCFVFMLACAIEVIVGGWGSTYLVDALGQNADDAALVITFYYAGMALGRFVSGLLAQIWSSRRIIKVGCTIIAVAIVVLLLPLGDAAILTSSVAMFLIGFGNGPVYPNLVHMTPQSFGSANSQRAMGAQMASAYVGTMLFQPCFGLLAQLLGAGIFPLCIAVLFAMMIVFLALYLFSASKNKAI